MSVLKGANAPRNRTVERNDDGHSEFNRQQGYESREADVEVVAQSAAEQQGSRPDGWAADAPLPESGGTRHAQEGQREVVRQPSKAQLGQVNPIVGARKR